QEGGCGGCTVLVDGEPRRACLLPLAAVDGASVTTAEGVGEPGRLSTVQAAFHEQYGIQCGFCTPGFVLATTALLERNPSPTRDEILEELGGRSEEHTSELQSLRHLVCRLLREKKKRIATIHSRRVKEPGMV